MRQGATAAVLVVLTLTSLLAPVPAAALECPDEDECGSAGCCLDCSLCPCCSVGPQTMLPGAVGVAEARDDGLHSDLPAALPEPFPRDILHVPRPAPLR